MNPLRRSQPRRQAVVVQGISVLSGVSAMIETVPLDQAAKAYANMMAGKARFRIVLTMD